MRGRGAVKRPPPYNRRHGRRSPRPGRRAHRRTHRARVRARLDAARFRDGIVEAARAVAGFENALIDIQNERDVYGPFVRPLAPADVAATAAAIKRADPRRIVTASNSPGLTPAQAARFTAD